MPQIAKNPPFRVDFLFFLLWMIDICRALLRLTVRYDALCPYVQIQKKLALIFLLVRVKHAHNLYPVAFLGKRVVINEFKAANGAVIGAAARAASEYVIVCVAVAFVVINTVNALKPYRLSEIFLIIYMYVIYRLTVNIVGYMYLA